MARISVVVPVYNVEEYLRECLDSVAEQSFTDFEVVMVDDGSTDGSVAIAQEFAERDPRFRLITQPNGGLGAARNTGTASATGEFLHFLDSDDAIPKHALRTLLRSLDRTGSDFATGDVLRFNRGGTSPVPFLAGVFSRTRRQTHVTKFRPLISDRPAWNKLFRRSFWDQHGFSFPPGVTNEDIPVILPAHFLAKSVDVIAEPVYLYRLRETGGLSITQRRLEPNVLRDRLAAVSHVSSFLAKHNRKAKRWYDQSVVKDDLRHSLNVLHHADETFRNVFLDEVNAFLDTLDRKAFEPLTAIERVKWQLVRLRRMDELVEVIRFQRERLTDTPPVQIDGRWYGDYPYLDDAAVGVPRSAYELRQELTLAAQLDDVRWEGDLAHITGHAFITAIGAPEKGSQRLSIVAMRKGRFGWWRRVRRRIPWLGIRIRTEPVHRPELTAVTRQRLVDVQWAGFAATVRAAQLERFRLGRSEQWELYADVHAGRIKRRTVRFQTVAASPVRTADLRRGNGALLRIGPGHGRRLRMELLHRWAVLTDHGVEDAEGHVVLRGELHGLTGPGLELELVREEGLPTIECPVTVDGSVLEVRVTPADLLGAAEEEQPSSENPDETIEHGLRWQLVLLSGRQREPLRLAEDAPVGAWRAGEGEVALGRSLEGDGLLVVRAAAPVLTAAAWSAEGTLRVDGMRGAWTGPVQLVLHEPVSGRQVAFRMSEGDEHGFSAELEAARVESLGGALPLSEGSWHICVRPPAGPGSPELPRVAVARGLLRTLPLATTASHKAFSLGASPGDRALLTVARDLDDDERGPLHQRELASTAYAARRGEPLRDLVVYTSFGGRQCSDSPRAVHAELLRRGSPVEHVWVVRDGMALPPAGAMAVRAGSREHHEALATARYVVINDHLPEFFARRKDQVVLQTWHGTPLKHLGSDVSSAVPTQRRFDVGGAGETDSWQHVLSPNAFSTPILQRALGLTGEIHETGYPRNDVLRTDGREERSRAVRERLGIAPGVRTVLYAPTFRDHIIDRRGRPRLDLHLDVEALRGTVSPDTVVLFRKHHHVVDPVPATADGFVRDVTAYPDANELMLAADVLVTDYSAMPFDYALTGRPMILFAYDLETYRDDVRGLYLDPETEMPAPIVRTTEELAEALGDLEGVRSPHAAAYGAFTERFCALEDGGAAARAADLLTGPATG